MWNDGRSCGAPRGRPGWLVPLAAAVAVIAVAVTLVSVRDAAGRRPTSPGPAATLAPGPYGAVPSYYAAVQPGTDAGGGLADVGEVNAVVVGNARTGGQLASLKPPKGGTFDGVTAAADDRTFIIAERSVPSPTGSQHVSYRWYLLRIFPGAAQPARLTTVPITDPFEDAVIHGLALSPDGRTLAVIFTPSIADGGTPGPTTLRTYSVVTGKLLRSWTGAKSDGLVCFDCTNTVALSWLANGHTLAFIYPEAVLPQAVRTLDLSTPGDSLDADSRAIFTITADDSAECIDGLLSPDRRTILCGAAGAANATHGCATYGAPFDAYGVATGKLERVLYRYRGSCGYAQSSFVWAGSGTVAIGLLQEFTKAAPQPQDVINGTSKTADSAPEWDEKVIFGLIASGKFTPLHVTMRDESAAVQASGPGLIAF